VRYSSEVRGGGPQNCKGGWVSQATDLVRWARVLVVVGLGLMLSVAGWTALAQEQVGSELFGDSFVGKGQGYVGSYDGSNSNVSESVYEDRRGTVEEWQFSRGNLEVKREVWSDERGSPRGLFSFGRRF
jgi:hypothetical protein